MFSVIKDYITNSSNAIEKISKIYIPTLSIQQMQKKDLKMVMNWCKEEGWNIGKYDADLYYSLDSKGHYLFLLDDQPIGAISFINYNCQLLTIGPFIVKKEYRNRGYGAKIWQTAMGLLEKQAVKTSSLYAVPAQISRYTKSNFEENFSNQRWQKLLTSNVIFKLSETKKINNVECVNSQQLESVAKYDQSIFSVSREKLLDLMIKNKYIKGFVSTNEEGKVIGFGFIRPCIDGYRVGPLYADDIETAKVLFQRLLNTVSNTTIFIDAPISNPYSEALAEYFNLERVSKADTVAMFRGKAPTSLRENDKNYAHFSLEIG